MRRALVAFAATSLVFLLAAYPAVADDETAALFARATKALDEGRATEAIAAFESLADQGVVDPVASYDRGLAYAMRVRIGGELPGDLGRAAQGFEEACETSNDPKLEEDASRALVVVRSEVAKRRARAGQRIEVDPGRSLGRTLSALLPESAWANLCVVTSALLALSLFVRWLARARRLRVSGGVAAGIAMPVLAAAVTMTLAARHDRASLRESVIVTNGARPADERGIVLPGAVPLPEGARVEVVETRAGLSHVRFGTVDAWVPTDALREVARKG
jgi:hypothetical protein